jgi:DNA-binding Lrp family transcriptional regulator
MSPTPFADLADELHITEAEILSQLRALKDSGVIRRIGASIDSGKAGYVSTLVACKVDPTRIEDGAREIGRNPGVTHSYERDAAHNLWFTLIAETDEQIANVLERYRLFPGVLDLKSLPATRVYKLKVRFVSSDD